ncbi:hypothetical protein CALVIDRAFT_365161 [Calocera viscosa TUFC12733]|uniref:Uncharacterized protein n=1 Tax=Calocera viscosa (strain TUFC12733) TaxID=1330018 RepID=A0A167H5X3_CALVF|nr:hypothetical protein CALVIDRAFT_365161 [Calocera viscosa TUFC12733]
MMRGERRGDVCLPLPLFSLCAQASCASRRWDIPRGAGRRTPAMRTYGYARTRVDKLRQPRSTTECRRGTIHPLGSPSLQSKSLGSSGAVSRPMYQPCKECGAPSSSGPSPHGICRLCDTRCIPSSTLNPLDVNRKGKPATEAGTQPQPCPAVQETARSWPRPRVAHPADPLIPIMMAETFRALPTVTLHPIPISHSLEPRVSHVPFNNPYNKHQRMTCRLRRLPDRARPAMALPALSPSLQVFTQPRGHGVGRPPMSTSEIRIRPLLSQVADYCRARTA